MTQDTPRNIDDAKGRAKEAAGDLKQDDDLKEEGKLDRAAGKAKDTAESARDKAEDAIDEVRDRLQRD